MKKLIFKFMSVLIDLMIIAICLYMITFTAVYVGLV